jgi:hypothetical protein
MCYIFFGSFYPSELLWYIFLLSHWPYHTRWYFLIDKERGFCTRCVQHIKVMIWYFVSDSCMAFFGRTYGWCCVSSSRCLLWSFLCNLIDICVSKKWFLYMCVFQIWRWWSDALWATLVRSFYDHIHCCVVFPLQSVCCGSFSPQSYRYMCLQERV